MTNKKINPIIAALLLLLPVVVAVVVVLSVNASRLGLGQAPAKPDEYPRFGHAEDFSWIAGQVVLHISSGCDSAACDCFIVRYDEEKGTQVQVNGPAADALVYSKIAREGEFLILFGHLAQPDEQVNVCPKFMDDAVYVVERVQPPVGAGKYPLFGHAEDFSWIAGQMELNSLRGCTGRACGCSIIRYDEKSDLRVQLYGPNWNAIQYADPSLEAGLFLIVFGRPARPGELTDKCRLYRDALGYFVDSIEVRQKP